jgi:hypothetical protein
LFVPDRHGRYGPSTRILTEDQALYVKSEVWFCADWALNNICMWVFSITSDLFLLRAK